MIVGTVSVDLEPIIRISVRSPSGQDHEFDAVVDTGFNGFLTLPPTDIAALGLSRLGWGRVLLANGAEELFEIFEANVIWDGQPLAVEAEAADTDCLVGTALLLGHELRLQVLDGGNVTIAALP